MQIIINPGHGKNKQNPDPGATATDGTHERDHCLAVVAEIQKLIPDAAYIGISPTTNVDEIAIAADKLPAGVFVAIHCNAPAGNAQGVEIWYETENEDAREFAATVLGKIIGKTMQKSRGTKDEKYYSQKYLRVFHDKTGKKQSKHVAILVEMGFLSGKDLKLIKENPKLIAQAIVEGIYAYLGEPVPSPEPKDAKEAIERAIGIQKDIWAIDNPTAKALAPRAADLLRKAQKFLGYPVTPK